MFNVNPAWDTEIFNRVMREWTKAQRPISSLEIKLAVRAITGPGVPVLQHEISALLMDAFKRRHDDTSNARVGWFDLYESQDEKTPDGKSSFIRYHVPKPLNGVQRLLRNLGSVVASTFIKVKL
jgi:hypothetical protein